MDKTMDKTFPKDGHYLIYVTRFDMFARDHRCTDIYECTGDPFHAMGEIQYRILERIYSITLAEDKPERRKYWAEKGVKITPWINKY